MAIPAEFQGAACAPGSFHSGALFASVDTCEGVLRDRFGTRLVALPDDFLLGMREILTSECGEAAGEVMRSCGKKYGQLIAVRDQRVAKFDSMMSAGEWPVTVFMATVEDTLALHGWGRPAIDLSHHGEGVLLVTVHEPVMAGIGAQAATPVEELMEGFLAGYVATLAGIDLDCLQLACVAHGAPAALFAISHPARLEPLRPRAAALESADRLLAALLASRVSAA